MSHVKNNMGGLVKKNAWYAGWFATMAAAGWAIDELTGQVTKPTVTYRGRCQSLSQYVSISQPNMLMHECIGAMVAALAVGPAGINGYKYADFKLEPNAIDLFFVDQWGTKPFPRLAQLQSYSTVQTDAEPVPDDALYQALASEMLKDTKAAAQAFMVPDAWPYPYPNLFPDPVKYIPGVSEADEQLLDALIKGQLQTTNPSAANYVTPEKLQQLQNMLSQLQQGLTPEGQVGAANEKLKDALTQAQLEETINKEKDKEEKAVKDALGEKPSFDKLTEPLDKFVENVNKTPQDEINPLPQNTFGIAGSGTCYLIQKPISIMGFTVDMSTRSFCEAYYYPYFLPILTWFFYIATGLYIWFSLRDAYSRRI